MSQAELLELLRNIVEHVYDHKCPYTADDVRCPLYVAEDLLKVRG